MVSFKELVNTAILNSEKWIGFMGDSEYISEEGELIMGMWAFLNVSYDELDFPKENYLNCQDEYSDSLVEEIIGKYSGECDVLNDNGHLCHIKLFYDVDNMPTVMNGNVYVE